MRFMLELQKLLIKYSNKGVCPLSGSFPFFKTCSSLHGNYGRRLGVSSIRDTSSVRHSAVISFSNSYMLTSKEFRKYQFHSELAELCHNRSPVRVSGGSQTILCKYI